jgi:hypothetical protein
MLVSGVRAVHRDLARKVHGRAKREELPVFAKHLFRKTQDTVEKLIEFRMMSHRRADVLKFWTTESYWRTRNTATSANKFGTMPILR